MYRGASDNPTSAYFRAVNFLPLFAFPWNIAQSSGVSDEGPGRLDTWQGAPRRWKYAAIPSL
jgi:hypothetical protein